MLKSDKPGRAIKLRHYAKWMRRLSSLNRKTALAMVFKLCQSASKKWRRLDGSHQFAEIIKGVKFKDGEKLIERAA